jgi:hypothetical protein
VVLFGEVLIETMEEAGLRHGCPHNRYVWPSRDLGASCSGPIVVERNGQDVSTLIVYRLE